MKPNRQITFEERSTLGVLRQQGYSCAAIARVLHRDRSTISHEVRRNSSASDGRSYRPQLAHWYYRRRLKVSRRNSRFSLADWADKRADGHLHVRSRRANKPFRKRDGGYDSRARLAGKRPIEDRPSGAAHRSRLGHREGDTVPGDSQGGPCSRSPWITGLSFTATMRSSGRSRLGSTSRRRITRGSVELMRMRTVSSGSIYRSG